MVWLDDGGYVSTLVTVNHYVMEKDSHAGKIYMPRELMPFRVRYDRISTAQNEPVLQHNSGGTLFAFAIIVQCNAWTNALVSDQKGRSLLCSVEKTT
mmetsp:Transcript_47960/g.144936  ORF Transcript_47960/g.144936 Transcript_47960/m.144936 type:complete len:97 (-) Transcript_47960:114-404(-)